ncbi:MAG: hypothetical protein HQM10_10605 [Candidatus Riflebacteria bacterium]|nr:hypothetical protein [Candidatus Riflebacteria bacterium]
MYRCGAEYVDNKPPLPAGCYEVSDKAALRIKEVEVKSRDHLLKLMGFNSGTPMNRLPADAAGLLAAYDARSSQYVISSANDAKPAPTVYLSDIEMVSEKLSETAKKYKISPASLGVKAKIGGTVRYAGTTMINIDSTDASFGGKTAEEAGAWARATLAHEMAHTVDNRVRTPGSYGADNKHKANEILSGNAAFKEGWAVLHEVMQSEQDNMYENFYKSWMGHDDVDNGIFSRDDKEFSLAEISGKDMLNNEMTVAKIFMDVARKIPDGYNKLKASFMATNTENGSFDEFLQDFVKKNPKDADMLREIMKEKTSNKLTDADINALLKIETTGNKEWAQTGTVSENGIIWKTDGLGNKWYTRPDGAMVCVDKRGERWETRDGKTWIDSSGMIWTSTDGRKTWKISKDGINWTDTNGNRVRLTGRQRIAVWQSVRSIQTGSTARVSPWELRNWIQNEYINSIASSSAASASDTSATATSTTTVSGNTTTTVSGNGNNVDIYTGTTDTSVNNSNTTIQTNSTSTATGQGNTLPTDSE